MVNKDTYLPDIRMTNGEAIEAGLLPALVLEDVASGQTAPPPHQEFDALGAFRKSTLDQTKDYPPPPPLMYFVQNGERFPHRTKKSFSLQQGKQKSKKTTELALEVGAYINPNPDNSEDTMYFECVEPGVVLFFDNEQGESYAARTMRLTLSIANLKVSERLVYCDLREYSPKERIAIINAGIESTPNVKWVIIDGIVDVMNDFMSAEEGHLVITDLLKLCSLHDIHVTGVLHQNKGASKDARAHVGSIAGQKCEVEVMVERDAENKDLSIVSAKESRGLPFEDFAIIWEKGSLPRIVQDWKASSGNYSQSNSNQKNKALPPAQFESVIHWKILQLTFVNREVKLRRSSIVPAIVTAVTEYQELKEPIGIGKASIWLDYWIKNKFILHEGTEGTVSSKFMVNQIALKESQLETELN